MCFIEVLLVTPVSAVHGIGDKLWS